MPSTHAATCSACDRTSAFIPTRSATMIRIVASLFVFTLTAGTSAFAAEAPDGNKAQTSKMSQCSADAKDKGLKGDARKDYMSQCLRSSESPAAVKQCNA